MRQLLAIGKRQRRTFRERLRNRRWQLGRIAFDETTLIWKRARRDRMCIGDLRRIDELQRESATRT